MNNPEMRHGELLNTPELQPQVGIDSVIAEQQAQSPDYRLADRIRESRIGVVVATVATIGAIGLATNRENGVQVAEATTYSAGHQASAATLVQNGFKKCRKGKPAFQARLVGPTPIKKIGYNFYKSAVPEVGVPVNYKLQAKSCKARKGVLFTMDSMRDHAKKKLNLQAGKVGSFNYKLTFSSPRDASDPYRRGARRVSLGIYQKTRGLSASMIDYYYTDEQLGGGSQSTETVPSPTQ